MNLLKKVLNIKKSLETRKYDYSHWDIHAMARLIDPEAWKSFDELPTIDPLTGREKYYSSFEPIKGSFQSAINLLKSGIYPCHKNLESDNEVRDFLIQKRMDK